MRKKEPNGEMDEKFKWIRGKMVAMEIGKEDSAGF